MMAHERLRKWMKNAIETLEELPPNAARGIAEQAIAVLGDVLADLEESEKTILLLRKEILLAKLPKLTDTPKSLADTSNPSSPRWPRVWRNSDKDPDDSGVVSIEDNDQDRYEKEGDSYRHVYSNGDKGSLHLFSEIVESFSPVIEVGEGIRKIRWFEDEVGEDFRFPQIGEEEPIFLLDGEGDKWARVNSAKNLWSCECFDSYDRKIEGYWTLDRIASESNSIMVLQPSEGFVLKPLAWERGEGEPHETITYVYSGKTNWYYRRNGDGLWYAPNTGGVMKEKHDGKEAVTWEELLNHAETLTEYIR